MKEKMANAAQREAYGLNKAKAVCIIHLNTVHYRYPIT